MRETVSLIFTIKDEVDSLGPFLDAIANQSRIPDEIVVVDGGSRDGTLHVLNAFASRLPVMRVLVADGASISRGRNIAIAQARGPIIAVTDAGTAAEPEWLEELTRPLESDASIGVSSGFFTPGGSTAFERSLTTVITPQLPEIDAATFLPSSRSVAFRKEWWERVGGYPEWLRHCEDLVFDLALRQHGARFVFSPRAVVTWNARKNLRGFARQYYNYARGDGHAHLWTERHAVRYCAYATGAVLLAAARRNRSAGALLAVGMLVHFGKFMRRLLKHPAQTLAEAVVWTPLVPIVVVTGDVAKMLGYPVGRWQRRQARSTTGLEARCRQRSSASSHRV